MRTSTVGFTLVELAVVVGIIAILAAMFTANIRKIRAGFDLRNASSVAVSEVRRAQSVAIAQGATCNAATSAVCYAVEFVLGKPGRLNTYKGTGNGTTIDWTLVRSVSGAGWPELVRIVAADPSVSLPDCGEPPGSSANKCVTFGFFGAPVSAGEVQLQSETGGITRIIVQPATGRVSAQ